MQKPNRSGVVVVAGASAGVGRAVAAEFARHGWTVALLARSHEGLKSAQREIETLGGRAACFPVDVADAHAVFDAAAQIEAQLGPIEVWVHNAMVTIYAKVWDISPEEFLRVTQVTYLGQVHGVLAALRYMRPRNRGAIVSIGSALAYRSIPLQAPYCAAKAATRGFIDSLRSELMMENSAVKLTMVHLPAVNTPQFDWARSRLPRKLAPLPPIYQPEAIARIVYRAAHENPREYWIGHSAVKAIAGQMMMPHVGDKILAQEGPSAEMTDEPADPNRPDNLFEAGQGDPGAHGRFDKQSSDYVFPFNPAWLRAGAGALGALAVLGALVRGRRRSR